jgi:hypothetical protein
MKRALKWVAIWTIAGFVGLVVLGIAVGSPDEARDATGTPKPVRPTARPRPTATPSYVGGLAACGHFYNVISDATRGFLTDSELREKLKEVQRSASTAEPPIRNDAAVMLSAITRGDTDGLLVAVQRMYQSCADAGY